MFARLIVLKILDRDILCRLSTTFVLFIKFMISYPSLSMVVQKVNLDDMHKNKKILLLYELFNIFWTLCSNIEIAQSCSKTVINNLLARLLGKFSPALEQKIKFQQ